MSDVQAPGTEHPAYADMAEMLRSALGRHAHSAIRVAQPGRMTADWRGWDDAPPLVESTTTYRTLEIKRAVGPAPFVGEPFDYMWHVAVDELGRQVAGDAWLAYWPDARVFDWMLGR